LTAAAGAAFGGRMEDILANSIIFLLAASVIVGGIVLGVGHKPVKKQDRKPDEPTRRR
jgi:hypothetical protein